MSESVFVIVFDYGMNGADVHNQSYATKAEAEAAAAVVERQNFPDCSWNPISVTGYGGWEIVEVRLPDV